MNVAAFTKINYGVYIISSLKDGKYNGQIANSVFQVTAEPPIFAISINVENLTHEYIEYSKKFSVSVLCQDVDMPFIGHFGFKSGRKFNKFDNIDYKIGKTEVPIVLDKTVAYFEAEVINQINLGTHTVFFGRVLEAQTLNDTCCLTYDYYHNVIKGKSPKTAPTYFEDMMKKKV